jgi:sodium/hydrogen antiporter
MNNFNTSLALLGSLILLIGLVSKRASESPVPPTLLALLIGVCIGPEALNAINLESLGDRTHLLELAARLALGIGLVGVALRIPSVYPRKEWRSILPLIGLGMPMMWAISTALVYLILGLPFWIAAVIGAILTPTDPVASTPIVTGALAEKNVPGRVRHLISFDSGANDGLAYLFVFLPMLMLTKPAGEALTHWFLKSLLWEVGLATLLGLALGYFSGKLLQISERAGAIERDWRLVYTVALALLAIGAGKLVHSDEILVVFAAAAAFDQLVSAEDRQNEEVGQEAVNRFFAIPFFVVLGTAIPWAGWRALGWEGVVLALAVLLLRRPVTLLLLRPWVPGLHGAADALFVGWFGPIAVAAVYYAAIMERHLGDPVIWHVASLVACASVLAHGVSGAPSTRWYGKYGGEKASAAERPAGSERG